MRTQTSGRGELSRDSASDRLRTTARNGSETRSPCDIVSHLSRRSLGRIPLGEAPVLAAPTKDLPSSGVLTGERVRTSPI